MKLWRRIRLLARRRQFEEDLVEELRFHREMSEESARRTGASTESARRESGRSFGGATLALEDSRAVWRFAWFDSLVQDIRYALRSFRKSPGFALSVIGTLSLGLGVLASAFCLFNAVVLRPYAVRDPHSLYIFSWTGRLDQHETRFFPSTWREYELLRTAKPGFSDLLAYHSNRVALAGAASTVHAVSGNYFSVLGGNACLGRPLIEADAQPGAPAVVVASYKTWLRRFNGDPAVIGSKVYMRAVPATLVGVACPEFGGLGISEYWVNMALDQTLSEGYSATVTVVGRLKPGLSEAGARAALLAYGSRARDLMPSFAPRLAEVQPAGTAVPLRMLNAGGIFVFFLIFALTLLIACANVSNMMLARALSRQREVGIRLSLGAGRWRLVRQMVTESLLLAIPSAIAAFGIAWFTIWEGFSMLVRSLPPQIGTELRLMDFSPDWRVLLFLFICAFLSSIILGLAPAIQATRSSLVQASRGDFTGDRRPARLRNALVAVQVTVCTLLLVSAGVCLYGQRFFSSLDDGLKPTGFRVSVRGQLRERVAAQLRSDPSVARVGSSFEGLPAEARGEAGPARVRCSYVSPEFFRLFGIAVLRGRNFTPEEARSMAPAAIVSESAARRLWPSGDPLGKTIGFPKPSRFRDWGELPPFNAAAVVGVVGDANFDADVLGRGSEPTIFLPIGSQGTLPASLLVAMKGKGEPARRALTAALDRAAPSAADQVVSLEDERSLRLYPVRILSGVASLLGALALLLTVAGIYGVLSYVVSQRRKEIGIRVALGARPGDVTGMVVRQCLRLTSIGAAMGAALAFGVAKLVAHSMSPFNVFAWPGYAAGVATVIAAALAAAYVPARRAVKVNPAVTLRCD